METSCMSIYGIRRMDGLVFRYPEPNTALKVVGNEKEGGSGKWQMIDIGLGLW
jgi:hypothetical protein